jgi:hypothetical protein
MRRASNVICAELYVHIEYTCTMKYSSDVFELNCTFFLGWVGCILLRYNEMGDFCCTINATYIFVISYYTFFHTMFRLLTVRVYAYSIIIP